jgi:tetratricopeptide (TPR) repeat protein
MLTSLAETYLEADVETERALEVVKFALQYGSDNWLARLIGKGSKPVTVGVYGWALARLGRFKEADSQIQKALKRIPAKNKAGVAYLHYIKGRIEALKGNSTQAAEWYQRASQNDKGLYGQLAETALKGLPPSQ